MVIGVILGRCVKAMQSKTHFIATYLEKRQQLQRDQSTWGNKGEIHMPREQVMRVFMPIGLLVIIWKGGEMKYSTWNKHDRRPSPQNDSPKTFQ